MNLARSDTYINVYLPREDGGDPRKWARPSSPVFNSDEVYKFSEEIVKDRKLFLGKRQMSLYEIYYKDNKESGSNSADETKPSSEDEQYTGSERQHDSEHVHPDQRVVNSLALPRVSKVSISLDQRLRRSQRGNIARFNEPATSYSIIKSHIGGSKYNPNQSLERQVTSFDVMRSSNRRIHTSDNLKSAKARTQHISRLFKKVQSAPSEAHKIRSLGLPPISRSNTALTSLVPDVSPEVSRLQYATNKTQPLRPSSKPHVIWKQTTNVLIPSSGSIAMLDSRIGRGRMNSSRSRLTTASDIFV